MDESKIKKKKGKQAIKLDLYGKEITLKKEVKREQAFDDLPDDLFAFDKEKKVERDELIVTEEREKEELALTITEMADIGTQIETSDPEIESLNLIPAPKNRRYSIEHKIQALSFLFGSLKPFESAEGQQGFVPSYKSVSLLTGIPESTLRKWWLGRDELERTASTVKERTSSFVSLKLLLLVNKAVDEVTARMNDPEVRKKASIKDLMQVIKDGSFHSRVLGNLSTQNVAVLHGKAREDNFASHDPLDVEIANEGKK